MANCQTVVRLLICLENLRKMFAWSSQPETNCICTSRRRSATLVVDSASDTRKAAKQPCMHTMAPFNRRHSAWATIRTIKSVCSKFKILDCRRCRCDSISSTFIKLISCKCSMAHRFPVFVCTLATDSPARRFHDWLWLHRPVKCWLNSCQILCTALLVGQQLSLLIVQTWNQAKVRSHRVVILRSAQTSNSRVQSAKSSPLESTSYWLSASQAANGASNTFPDAKKSTAVQCHKSTMVSPSARQTSRTMALRCINVTLVSLSHPENQSKRFRVWQMVVGHRSRSAWHLNVPHCQKFHTQMWRCWMAAVAAMDRLSVLNARQAINALVIQCSFACRTEPGVITYRRAHANNVNASQKSRTDSSSTRHASISSAMRHVCNVTKATNWMDRTSSAATANRTSTACQHVKTSTSAANRNVI